MCDWCDKAIAKGDGSYGILCPRKAGQFIANIVQTRLMGDPMTPGKQDDICVTRFGRVQDA